MLTKPLGVYRCLGGVLFIHRHPSALSGRTPVT